jgi:type IV secretory pathway VirB2 component (pilin)
MSSSVNQAGQQAASAAHRAGESRWIDRAARLGLAGRGLVYALIAVLAFQIAFVDRAKEADQKGAFQTLAQNGFGKVVLWLVIIGFVGYAVWLATEAVWGHWREQDKRKRTAKRVESAVKAVIYLLLAVLAFRIVTATSSGDQGAETVTAKVLDMTGGQFLVGLAGVVVIAVAALITWRGLRTKFEEHLDLSRLGPTARSVVINLGKVGYIARGVTFAIVGILIIAAAVTYDPNKARGFDAALRTVAAQPYGPWLLSLIAVGLLCFGVYSFIESRYRRL